MWDENPEYQKASWKLLRGVVVFAVLVHPVIALVTNDWSAALAFYKPLMVVLICLGIYAAIVCTTAHFIRFLLRIVIRNRQDTH